MNRIFTVDGNWYLHRVFHTLRTSRPIEEALPYSLVGLIMKDACATKATHVLVAFDGPKVFRYNIFAGYKANRNKGNNTHEDEGGAEIYSYLPAVRAYLEASGLVWIQPKTHEADDVLASASAQYGSIPSTRVIMGSRDKDGYQSLKPNVVAYDSTQDPPEYITMELAEKRKGVKISQMIMYQTLIGDSIDNIPSFLKPAAAKKIISTWDTFKAWVAGGTKEDIAWLRANQVKLQLNKKLVEMDTGLALPPVPELVVPKLERTNMPKAWYAYQAFLYPKSKGLFKR